MPWAFIIPAAASLIGGSMQADAASDAASTAAASSDRATALQQRMYEEGVARQQPYYQAGVNALGQMQGMTGAMPAAFTGQVDMTRDPGYQFRLSEGMKALERSAAARGGLLSGGTGRALTRYGQDVASQEYGSAYNRALTEYNAARARESEGYNRLAGLAGVGGTTAQQIGLAGQTMAGNVGNIMMGQGALAGQAAIARGSAYGGTLNRLGELAGRYYGQPQTGPQTSPVSLPGYEGMYGPDYMGR